MDTALRAGQSDTGMAIMIDRQGGMRVLDPTGWTTAALAVEFGALSVFRVAKTSSATSVEALAGSDRCVLERRTERSAAGISLTPDVCHPIRLQAAPLLLASSNACESAG
jgi:hypothetical protein